MCKELCRLCLSCDNLKPIFVNKTEIDRYALVLSLTTGLKIKPEDGLPQQICTDCSKNVNTSLNFRNKAHKSEIKLLQLLGYRRIDNTESHIEREIEIKNEIKQVFIETNNLNEDDKKYNIYFDTKEKEISNELKLESEDECDIENNTEIEETSNLCSEINKEISKIYDDCKDFDGLKKHNEVDFLTDTENGVKSEINSDAAPKVKISRKERKELYLSLIDGEFNPKGPIKCKICHKSVSKWSCFISHAKLHLGFKFMCEFCGKKFISTTQLKRHCRSKHGLKREISCKLCNYLAIDSAQLKVHERRYHTGERPYICDTCGASYYSRNCLVQHIESHNTIASIQCEQCNHLFKSRRHLARHKYSTHKGTRSTCPVCARTYSRKYLRIHINKHHNTDKAG